MKVIVQIPCYNEEATLARVVGEIPKYIPGIDAIEVLVVDDGSTDGTAQLARALGVHHIVRHTVNQGLAKSFRTGLNTALALGADIIVNTDGDNQYPGAEIPKLIEPILAGRAEIVVGDRRPHTSAHFSFVKKRLQLLGSYAVRVLSGTAVPDAVSGFRAISRAAAFHLNIVSPFSYTIEMLIQAGNKQLAIETVPIHTNPPSRQSRLARSTLTFVGRSAATMVRVYSMYRPLSTFFYIGSVILVIGALPIARFLYFYALGEGAGRIQSLIIGGVLVTVGFMVLMIGLLADLINFNRQLIEITLEKVRKLETKFEDGTSTETPHQSRPSGRQGLDGK